MNRTVGNGFKFCTVFIEPNKASLRQLRLERTSEQLLPTTQLLPAHMNLGENAVLNGTHRCLYSTHSSYYNST